MKKRETVGKASRDLLVKQDGYTPTANEATEGMLSEYDKNIHECIERHKKTFKADFYVVVVTKKERLMKNVLRNYFFGRLSCPTPDYDQTVYKYCIKESSIEFLWTIPDKNTSLFMLKNRLSLPPDQYELLNYVLKFEDRTLFKLAKKLNGEKLKTSELEQITRV